MTTMTFDAVTTAHAGSVMERVATIVAGTVVAALPFAAIAWMFIAR
jgi:hypothetical protein